MASAAAVNILIQLTSVQQIGIGFTPTPGLL